MAERRGQKDAPHVNARHDSLCDGDAVASDGIADDHNGVLRFARKQSGGRSICDRGLPTAGGCNGVSAGTGRRAERQAHARLQLGNVCECERREPVPELLVVLSKGRWKQSRMGTGPEYKQVAG